VFGGVARGTSTPCDLDVAVELFDKSPFETSTQLWIDNVDAWRKELAARFSIPVQLELLDNPSVLYAVCHPDNRSSIAVMVKLGMRFRGVEDWYAQKVATYEITTENWAVAHGTTSA
jgi:hypothetical protein